jgi:hydroxymethylbilane synthase
VTSGAPLRIGTRGSSLALWQTEYVRALLHSAGHRTERVEIRTTGDLIQEVPLASIGSRALFTKQIDDAMLEGRIDLAVHSLKDLPTTLPAGVALGAIGEREDPRDALVGHGPCQWEDLPNHALIATSSLRRRAQLLHLRPDFRVTEVRGNVGTRLAKLDAKPEWSGILLATAGLVRLGLESRIGERLAPSLMLPAPGQGALAVTLRDEDEDLAALVRRAVHHRPTALAVSAERAFLRRLEGGCQVPVGAHAGVPSGSRSLELHGRVISLNGERVVDGVESAEVDDEAGAAALGTALADRLLAQGAGSILAAARAAAVPPVPEP